MAKIHTLTYNGTKSSDLGVFVSGSGSFDAAEFDVDKYEIPGRNGDLILSNNRYKNIEITYPAFIPKAFMDKAQNVRNWLRSSKVYARLEDTYDMDHYRLGIPTGVQSFSPENRNDGANFEMTFDCKPQRFLKVGETPETVEADVQTETGEIVTFETVAESPITSASVALSPIQSLNGYDSPWPGGGRKNILPDSYDSGDTYTSGNVTFKKNADGSVTVSCSTADSATRNYSLIKTNGASPFKAGTYITTCGNVTGQSGGNKLQLIIGSGNSTIPYSTVDQNNPKTFTLDSDNATLGYCLIQAFAGFTGTVTVYPMIRKSTISDATWEPYSNICPISGHTGAELNIAAEYDAEDKTTYSVTFPESIYDGNHDFISGKATATMASVDLGTLNYTYMSLSNGRNAFVAEINGIKPHTSNDDVLPAISSMYSAVSYNATWGNGNMSYTRNSTGTQNKREVTFINNAYTDAASFKTAMAGQTLVYELETPIEYTSSHQQLTTLQGQNVVWSDGTVTLTYAEPYNINNPTLFDARPLFTVTNPAEGDVIMVNGQAITFVDGYTGTVYIDCETMNAFSGAANLNSIIQATDFPVLVPGTNIVTWTGAGECTMTPRWWEL